MARRRLVGVTAVAIVAAIAIISIGARDDAEPVASADARPAPGEYAGRTSQGLPVTVTVDEDGATLTLDIRWRCPTPPEPGADTVRPFRHRAATIDRDGTVSVPESTVASPEGIRETGRLAARTTASGTLRGTWSGDYGSVTDDTDLRCARGAVSFVVRRRCATPGTDAAGQPVIALDGPREVAAGAGHVWVLEQGPRGAEVVRIDPATGALRARTSIGRTDGSVAPPRGSAFAPVLAAGEGAAWVVTGILGPRLELTRIDARTKQARRVAVTPAAAGPGGVAPAFGSLAAGAGALWMLVGDRVLRLDARSGRVVRSIRLTPASAAGGAEHCGRPGAGGLAGAPAPQAERLAIGAGAVWVASKCGPRPSRFGYLSRIDPRTNRVTRAVALRHSYSKIAAGRAGLWAATATATLLPPRPPEPALHRIDPAPGRPASVTSLPEGNVVGLGVAAGAVWVAVEGAPQRARAPVGTLHRLNPRRRARLSTALRLESPASLAVDGGRVWVVDAYAQTLRRAGR